MPKVSKIKKSRGWCLTINNFSQDDLAAFDGVECRYKIRGIEVGAEGTPHLQCFVFFQSAVVFKRLKLLFPRAHIEAAKGTPVQNRAYCSKDGKFEETGDLPVKGARNDIHKFVMTVAASKERIDEDTLLTEHSQMVCRYPTFVARVQRHFHRPKANEQAENYWFYGVPRAGKSYKAKQLGTYYVKKPHKWHDCYNHEEVVIIDDLQPSHMATMAHFLKIWCDTDPYEAQVKNGTIFIRPRIIVVTSNYSIDEMGLDDITALALHERFSEEYFATKSPFAKKLKGSQVGV